MGTGLIYVMVVGLWALFLLPMWVRNHERIDEGRQVDRFRRAMTQLSHHHVEVISSSQHKQVEVKRAVRSGTPVEVPLTPAARRRRVLGVLAGLQIIGLLASAVGAGVLASLIPAALIVAFLVMARSQVRREREAAVGPRRTEVGPSKHSFARALAAARSARRSVERSPEVVEQAPAAPREAAANSWQPVRTPAPAYVSAPAATAIPRAIDHAGGWTGSSMVEAARAMAEQPDVPAQPSATAPVYAHVDLDATAEIPTIRASA